jgi:hypothetical protein
MRHVPSQAGRVNERKAVFAAAPARPAATGASAVTGRGRGLRIDEKVGQSQLGASAAGDGRQSARSGRLDTSDSRAIQCDGWR